ncbi:unnamed protein product [Bursaphelenchus xylophilus]|uniref:(pine wood nematode) hypothetical protein n=1 Tax=Bursaphelenchus xylophilus TaxID=6326 RepID=A0A1I7RVY8_BURXY|nr:unnamed protein product [Bursaphelenchus xylophilus]CAG9094893.1 unnamed protein product [Bursaphelenchus xylophilus]
MDAFSDRDRLSNGKIKRRYEFSNARLDTIFSTFNEIEPIETNSLTFHRESPPYAFSRSDCPFTPSNLFKLTIDGEDYGSIDEYMRKMMFRELVATDPPTKESCWALNLVERNVSTKEWEQWQLGRGLLHMQKALVERAKSDKKFRSLLNPLGDRFIVYTYRNDIFYGSQCGKEDVLRWFKMMADNRMSVKYPKGLPVTYKQLCCCPKVARRGYNVLGLILMALKETMKITQLDDIYIHIPPLETVERPITYSTRLTTQKRVHGINSVCGSVYSSRASLISDVGRYPAANAVFDPLASHDPNKRLRFDTNLFRQARCGTPASEFGDLNLENPLSPQPNRHRASSVSSNMEFDTRRFVQPASRASNHIEFDEEVVMEDEESDEEEIQFLGEVDKSQVSEETRQRMMGPATEEMEEKPDILEIKANIARPKCTWQFPSIFSTSVKEKKKGRESATSFDSGYYDRTNMGSTSTLNQSVEFAVPANPYHNENSSPMPDAVFSASESSFVAPNSSHGAAAAFREHRVSFSSNMTDSTADELLPATSEGLPEVTDADHHLLDEEQKPPIRRPHAMHGIVLDTIELE